MEVIKWAYKEGQKIILTTKEAEELSEALKGALRIDYCESGRFQVEIEEEEGK